MSLDNTPPTAAHRGLATPELLALILIHLDQQTLLAKAQHVCTTWRDVIHDSPALRRHLFLYIPNTEPHRLPEERVLNPLLAKMFPSWFVHLAGDDNHSPGQRPPVRNLPMRGFPKQITQSTLYVTRGDDNPFLRREASWMQMHVSDPPTRSVALYRSRFARGMREKRYAHPVYYPDGLRMMHLYLLTLPESTDTLEMLGDFKVLWAPPGSGGVIMEAHALAAHPTGLSFPAPERGSAQACAKKIGSIGAELLVNKKLAFFTLPSRPSEKQPGSVMGTPIMELYEGCGMCYFLKEFAEEMRPYQHKELVLADTISSYGTVV